MIESPDDPARALRLETVGNVVRARSGMSLDAGRASDVERALLEVAKRRDLELGALVERLSRDPSLQDELSEALTITETFFFREPEHFRFLEEEVLLEIAARREGPIDIWSAGCASGEEVYSVAALCHRMGLSDRARILGTDISSFALGRAEKGAYRDWSFRGLAPDTVASLCTEGPNGSQNVRSKFRTNVRFGRMNLLLDDPPGRFDIVLCRNVLIHLAYEVHPFIARKLHAALEPGGWLITASADPLLSAFAPLEVVTTPLGMFHRARSEPIVDANLRVSRAGRSRGARGLMGRGAGAEVAEGLALGAPSALESELRHAMMLAEAGELTPAVEVLGAILEADPSLAIAHYTLGLLLERRGSQVRAQACHKKARELLRALPETAEVPLADGQRAGLLLWAVERRIAWLESRTRGS